MHSQFPLTYAFHILLKVNSTQEIFQFRGASCCPLATVESSSDFTTDTEKETFLAIKVHIIICDVRDARSSENKSVSRSESILSQIYYSQAELNIPLCF